MGVKMKKIIICCILFFSFGCGDVGSSDVRVDQDQNTIQSDNPEPTDCKIQCTKNQETGEILAIYECSGSAPFLAPIADSAQCTTLLVDAENADGTNNSVSLF